MAGEMHFGDVLTRRCVDVRICIEAEVVRADVDVVDVEQQPATGASAQLDQKLDFTVLVLVGHLQIVRRIFDQNRALDRVLRPLNVVGDAL